MHQKIAFLFFASTLVATGCFAQAVNERIERQSRDPKTAENAAKADVYIMKQKTDLDSVQTKAADKRAERKKFRKSCRKKRSL